MRSSFRVLGILLSLAVVVAQTTSAQLVPAPLIQNVTVNADTSVITIAGSGLGPDVLVTVDGQAVTLLPGAIATRVDIQAPAAVLMTPGTYRLTVVDPVRQRGDAFVVVSQPVNGSVGGASVSAPAPTSAKALSPSGSRAARTEPTAVSRSVAGPSPLTIIEDSCNTAIGVFALSSNINGCANAAIGAFALAFSTSGGGNTATGSEALFSNTTGRFNTASGWQALRSNTSADANTAVGNASLFANTTGSENAASGAWTLYSNTGGIHNTATGAYALYANTTGNYNAASGNRALASNTTGYYNTADGVESLSNNTTGFKNTASGLWALLSNTTGGQNTAVGFNAGANVTTGAYNVYVGADVTGTAADTNTIRIGLPYNGGVGQNQTFIAGIHGTQLTGPAVQVFIDANGRLGTLTVPLVSGTGTVGPMASPPQVQEQRATIEALQRQVEDQQKINAELRARLARLETLVASAGSRK